MGAPRPAATLSRTVALLTGGLALVSGARALDSAAAGRPDATDWLAATVAVVAAVVAVRMWRCDTFECRLVAGLVAAATLVGEGLTSFVGLPGNPEPHLTLIGAAAAALAVGILVLLGADAHRSEHSGAAEPPYAL